MRINKSLITYIPATGAGSGTVTSVALSAPTGFTVSGSPITSSGTLTLAFASGYSLPTTAKQTEWDTAYTLTLGAALTKVDDTNVTLTLGGTPATSLLRATSLTLGWAGQLSVSRGGTGAATLTGVLIGNGTSAVTAVVGGPSQLLRRNSAGTAYEFFTASFLTNPMTLNYDMIYQSGGVPTRLPGPTSTTKQFLTAVGDGTNTTSLAWGTIAATDITAAALTKTDDTNVTLTLGGTPATSLIRAVSLTLGWSGTLAVGRGGSGASTLTGVLVGNGTSAFTAVVGTAGQFLRRNLANTAYEFRTLQGGDIAGSELTFTNDTNVTMSLSGTPASALLQPVNISLGWTGSLSVSRGGTGASTLTGVLIGNGTSAVTAITGTANQILRRNSGNTAYEFWTANYMVNPMTLEGSIIYAATGGTPTELFANSTSTRKYLSQINGTAPTWEALPASVSGSGTTNYVAKWTSSTALGNSLILDNGTNIGIGDASPSVFIDAYKSTGGIIRVRSGDGGAFYVSNSGKTGTIAAFGDSGGIIGGAADTTAMVYSGGVPMAFYVNSFERARITTSGLFGIGTNAPNSQLHTIGSLTVNDNIYLQRGSSSLFLPVMNFWNGTGSPLAGTKGDILAIGNTGGDAVVFVTNAAERLRITSVGYVGINKNVPVSHLDVAGSINISSTSYLTWGGAYGANIPTIQGTSGASAGFGFYAAGSTSGLTVAFNGDGSVKFYDYQSPTSFTGTAAAGLAVTNTGDLITTALSKTSTEGNYTPTWTGIANVDSVTAFECRWMRIGDTLTVSGKVAINATVDNTATSASFTLPTSASNPQAGYMNGVGVQEGGGAAGSILGYGYNTGIFELSPLVDTAVNYSFIFTYRII